MHRRTIPLLIAQTTTVDELLAEGTFGPNGDNCCAKWLIADGRGDGAACFQCPGCKTPRLVIDEAIRRYREEHPPRTDGKVEVFSNW